MADKKADLAGPGVSTYPEVAKILPDDYAPVLDRKETQKAVWKMKRFIEDGLCRELNLFRVEVPLIVSKDSGVNDYLDRDGSRTPIDFPAGLGIDPRIEAQVVQAATKWKRMALKQFNCDVGEGINTDMRAVRKDYFLDHDHSSYVDQWDWERRITAEQRNLDYLKDTVKKIWKVIYETDQYLRKEFPKLNDHEVSGHPQGAGLPARRGDPREVPGSAAQAARDPDRPGVPGDLHHRDRLGAEGRLPARDARRRLRRLVHADPEARPARTPTG